MLTVGKTTLCCLLLLWVFVTMARSAVVPSTASTTTALQPNVVDQYVDNSERKQCTDHSQCKCHMGVALCHQGYCFCVWAIKPEDNTSETELSASISHPSTDTSQINESENSNSV